MFRYANPYDFEPRVAEGDQVDYMDIVDEFDGQDVETEGWRLNSMLWCTCQTCEGMPLIQECLCCKELDTCVAMMEGLNRNSTSMCITNHTDFQYVVLLEAVLRAGLVARFDIRADTLQEPLENK